MATYPTAKMVKTTVAKIYPAGAPVPLPNPTATGTLPVIAVIGAAVATAMNMASKSPTALGLSLSYSWAPTPVALPTPVLDASLPSIPAPSGVKPQRAKSTAWRDPKLPLPSLSARQYLRAENGLSSHSKPFSHIVGKRRGMVARREGTATVVTG